MTEEEARFEALPGVWRAAKGYDPTKGTFQTYAFKFILHEIYEHVRDAQHYDAEILPETEARDPDVPDCDESSIRGALFWSRARAVPAGKRARWVSEQTAPLSSEDLEELLEAFGRLYPESAWLEDPALETVRSALLSQAVRAADREGKMVAVSDLAKMLRAKEYRRHMKKQYRSNSRLAREFGVSDQTVGAGSPQRKNRVLAQTILVLRP
jgi:predicted HTH transcriptional regulator